MFNGGLLSTYYSGCWCYVREQAPVPTERKFWYERKETRLEERLAALVTNFVLIFFFCTFGVVVFKVLFGTSSTNVIT